ncbi:MAG: hypothetical protein AAFR91_12830 [Pseudomonadota bacterium]
MATRLSARRRNDYTVVVFSAVAAVFFYLFQITVVFSVTTFDGDCMASLWLPRESGLFSPYWIVVVCVASLLATAVIWLVHHARNPGPDSLGDMVVYSVGIVTLASWLYTLRVFWFVMAYETGGITLEGLIESVPFDEEWLRKESEVVRAFEEAPRGFHVCRQAT